MFHVRHLPLMRLGHFFFHHGGRSAALLAPTFISAVPSVWRARTLMHFFRAVAMMTAAQQTADFFAALIDLRVIGLPAISRPDLARQTWNPNRGNDCNRCKGLMHDRQRARPWRTAGVVCDFLFHALDHLSNLRACNLPPTSALLSFL